MIRNLKHTFTMCVRTPDSLRLSLWAQLIVYTRLSIADDIMGWKWKRNPWEHGSADVHCTKADVSFKQSRFQSSLSRNSKWKLRTAAMRMNLCSCLYQYCVSIGNCFANGIVVSLFLLLNTSDKIKLMSWLLCLKRNVFCFQFKESFYITSYKISFTH